MTEPADIVAALENATPETRALLAEELATQGEACGPVAVSIAKLLGAGHGEINEFLTSALEDCGPPEPSDVGELSQLVNDDNQDVAYWAATLLGRLESDAVTALPALVEALEKPGRDPVRQRAAWALGKIGPDAAPALSALENAKVSSDPRLARLAATAIEEIQG